MTQCLLFGQDVTRWVARIPTVSQAAGDFGQVVIGSLPTVTGISKYGFWDNRNPASVFYGALNLFNYPLEILQDGVTVFDGGIQSIVNDATARTASVTLRSSTQAALEQGATYASATTVTAGVTPTTIARELLQEYSFAIDSASFGAAEAVFAANSVALNATYIQPDVTVLAILEQICQVTCSRIYAINGVFYFDTYQLPTSAPLFTFTDVRANGLAITLWSAPTVEPIVKDPSTGYTVEWGGQPVADFGATTAAKRTISAPPDAPLTITTLQSAVWIGEQWLGYLNRAQSRVTIQVPPWYGRSLSLGYPVAIQYSKWGESIIIDITTIDNSNRAVSTITGVTR